MYVVVHQVRLPAAHQQCMHSLPERRSHDIQYKRMLTTKEYESLLLPTVNHSESSGGGGRKGGGDGLGKDKLPLPTFCLLLFVVVDEAAVTEGSPIAWIHYSLQRSFIPHTT